MELDALCPYCGEPASVWVEPGDVGAGSRWVEDCPVCCRPWEVQIWRDEDDQLHVALMHQDA